MTFDPISAIHYPMGIAPKAGRLLTETDYERYIKQLILQVLLTSPGERINRPDFGAGVRRMVFAPNSQATASMVEALVFDALKRWLAQYIRVDEVKSRSVGETLEIGLSYTMIARGQRRFLNVEVAL